MNQGASERAMRRLTPAANPRLSAATSTSASGTSARNADAVSSLDALSWTSSRTSHPWSLSSSERNARTVRSRVFQVTTPTSTRGRSTGGGTAVAWHTMPNNLVVVILDSLRYDSWLAAAPRELARIGATQRRWSYASWTAPSHHNLLMGLLPHDSPKHVLASDHYKEDFSRYQKRLDVPGIDFASMLPTLWMPTFLRERLGYSCHAMVSM